MVQVDLSGAQRFFTQAGPDFATVARAHDVLTSGSGLGADFTGWLHLPQKIKETELDRIWPQRIPSARVPRLSSSSASAVPISVPAAPLNCCVPSSAAAIRRFSLSATVSLPMR